MATRELSDELIKKLVDAAVEAKSKAYAKYSHYHVGAALLTQDGKIFTGN